MIFRSHDKNNFEISVDINSMRPRIMCHFDSGAFARLSLNRKETIELAKLLVDAAQNMQTDCSFCGKTANQVTKLIAGPSNYICNECVDLCSDIIHPTADQEENK